MPKTESCGGYTSTRYAPGELPPPDDDRKTSGKNQQQIVALADWLARDLPDPDFLLGHWLTSTSRVLMVAPTGLGKTMFALAMAVAIAAGTSFLHWSQGSNASPPDGDRG